MRKDKILGCLLGAAIGDAMGAATETRTKEQIIEKFGAPVRDFIAPPDDTFARGNEAGVVTDDFSMAYVACWNLLENHGKADDEIARKSLLDWAKNESFLERFAGPTSRAVILAMRDHTQVPDKYGFKLVAENEKGTNGAAMKAGPMAVFSGGDLDIAFKNAMIMSMPTHHNNTALSGAGAIACATAKALKGDCKPEAILEAGLSGAKKGDEYGRLYGDTLANPSVYQKIKLAIQIASSALSADELMDEVRDVIDTSVNAYDSVPAAFAFIASCKGDPMEPIICAVNAGNDTDSVATMVGAVLGAYYGAGAFPKEYLELIERVNGYQLSELAQKVSDLLEGSNE